MNARTQRRATACAHIEAWQQSGLTITAYCQRHGLTRSAFGNWRRRYSMPSTSNTTAFVPLQLTVAPTPKPTLSAEITLQRGEWRLGLPPDISPTWLAELLRSLT